MVPAEDDFKPVIGLAGAPGAGKSAVAALLHELGCAVLDADAMARTVLDLPVVKAQLCARWGGDCLRADGSPDRAWIGTKVFAQPSERLWLEQVVHPLVHAERAKLKSQAILRDDVVAIVEDCPLLFEMGMDADCDAVLFVDAPLPLRQCRVAATRHWSPEELAVREKAQWPLDIKRARADYVLVNDVDRSALQRQTRAALAVIMSAPRDAKRRAV